MRLLGGCGDTATGAVGRHRVGRTALRGASLGPAHLEAPANRPLDDGEFLQVLHVAEQAVLPEIHRDAGGGRRWMHGPPRGAPSPAGPSGPGMPDARSPAPPTRRTLWSRSWPRASGARGRGRREIERGGSPSAARRGGGVGGRGGARGGGGIREGSRLSGSFGPAPAPPTGGAARALGRNCLATTRPGRAPSARAPPSRGAPRLSARAQSSPRPQAAGRRAGGGEWARAG